MREKRPRWNRGSGSSRLGGGGSGKEIDDPTKDGWDTEAFHDKVKKQFEIIGKVLTHPEGLNAAGVAGLVTDDFACGALRPGSLVTAFEDEAVVVRRNAPERDGGGDRAPAGGEHRGAEGLAQALGALAGPFAGAQDLHYKFKVFRVLAASGEVTTRQFFALSGRLETGLLEENATWVVRWAPGSDGAPPRMRSIGVEDYEQAAGRRKDGVLFSDCTAAVLGGNTSYETQFLRGFNHWLERLQDPRYFALLGNPGVAVGDVDGDGLEDLYICQEAGLPNRLFLQNPDGTARDASEGWGVDWLESSRSALVVDLDNDGDQDLAVAILGGVVLAENDGAGHFRVRDVLATPDDTMSLSAVDYDRDGRLDLYVCIYHQNEDPQNTERATLPGASLRVVVHDANNGGSNCLLRNETAPGGSWKFTDVTREAGLDANNQRWSFAAAWDDYDNDGDQDLYVANDYGRDNLYRNDSEGPGTARFVDVSEAAHIENSAGGMAITWGDSDRDGWMDAFVSNMYSSAGNRIAFQSKFQPEAAPELKRRFQRLARGNTLLRNLGDGSFEDLSAEAGIEMGRWAWGSHFVDLNNDGWEDLVVANGYMTTEDTGDL